MRGADASTPLEPKEARETSPHAWSRHGELGQYAGHGRNISTCVEQTEAKDAKRPAVEKHLHMRGADMLSVYARARASETSPHAWSRPPYFSISISFLGNISTCVEQTCPVSGPASPRRKHLHMRGADPESGIGGETLVETSPHAWSRPSN